MDRMFDLFPISTKKEFSWLSEVFEQHRGIRSYWCKDTYYYIAMYDNTKGNFMPSKDEFKNAGICGLHKLRRENSALLRTDIVYKEHRGKGAHIYSIVKRIEIGYRNLGITTFYVRCNQNSIETYEALGFVRMLDAPHANGYLPLKCTIESIEDYNEVFEKYERIRQRKSNRK